jgi:hypothetical protein
MKFQRSLHFAAILGIAMGLLLILGLQSAIAGNNGGNALNFGGAAYVAIPEGSAIDSLGTAPFTLEAWVYPRPRAGDLSIIRDHHDYSLYLNNARHLVAYVYPAGDRAEEDPWARAESAVEVTNEQWHHVASVWNGTTIQLYVDGNPVASPTLMQNAFGETATMQIGANAYVPGQGFDGMIDEVRIWNTARTATDIRSTMFQQLVGNESNLAGYWPFTESTGMTTADVSGHGNNGTFGTEVLPPDPPEYPQWIVSTAPLGSLATAYQNRISGMWASQPNTAADGYASGLDIANVNFLQQTGDDIIFGDNSAAFQGGVTSNLATTPHAKKRWARLWELDVNDVNANDGAVDLTFDISDAGGAGTFSPTGNYYLLKRPTGNTNDFVETTVISNSIAGDQVTFRVNVSELGSEFTLGADTNSPTAVIVQNLSGRPQANPTGFALTGLTLVIALGAGATLAYRRRRA